MPANEEGEFELVLGNRQLLSVFFIMSVLLLVFFVSGFLVGRNVTPATEVASTKRAPGKPVEVSPPGAAALPNPSRPPATSGEIIPSGPGRVQATQSVREPEPKGESKQETKKEAKAQKEEPAKPEPPKPEPRKTEVAKAETPKAEPKKAEPKKPAEPKADPPPAAGRGNTYLQVSATTETEGAALVAKLNGRGFAASTTPVPGRDLVRVLVSPYAGEDLAAARDKLRAAGYDSIPRRK